MAKITASRFNSLMILIIFIAVSINAYLTVQNKKFSDKQQVYIEMLIAEKADLLQKFKQMQKVDEMQSRLIEKLQNEN